MIRLLRLSDVAALLLFLGKSPIDEAKVRDKFSDKGSELTSAFPLIRSCLASRDEQRSYVCVHHGLIQGLVCLRSCHGPSSWEVERLLLATGHEKCCLGLLERVGIAGNMTTAERLFLRLNSNSPVVQMAKEACFNPYLTEFLYCSKEKQQPEPPEAPLALRPKLIADEHGLFRLYSSAVPIQVRKVEGMTFQEWQQSMDCGTVRELISEDAGEIKAWLRIRHDEMAGQFDIVAESGVSLEHLVDYGLSILHNKNPIYCLVPEFQQGLRHILEERGFHQVEGFSCFSKQFAVRVHEPKLMPLQA